MKETDLNYPISFIDDPGSHTMTVMDWYERDEEVFFRTARFGLREFPDLPPNVFPSDLNDATGYLSTLGPDFTAVGTNPFRSALFNGKGRHHSVPYNRSSLTIYEVEKGSTYRFRLIHTGTTYAFSFLIDNHTLKVMATDGYLVEPVEVDYIAIESGERYDFLLEANQESGDYWIRAQTFEVIASIRNPALPPYDFYDHYAEAILHYSGSDRPNSTEYENIPQSPRQCNEENPCKILNCPFGQFHLSYYIECISIDSLRLAEPTPESEMPDKEPDITYFANLAARRRKPASSINEKLFAQPRFPLTTHYEKNDENSFCDVNSVCESDVDLGCDCTTVMDTGTNLTVRVVISAIGLERKGSHPFHIHGHSVHIMGFGYGEYSDEKGFLGGSSLDLTCTDDGNDTETIDDNRCPNPRFRSPKTFPIDRLTVRKDTFIVPAGGYVVVQFRSNNPGYWMFHCHTLLHQREGLALIIREDVDNIKGPPEEMKTCNSFMWDVDEFMAGIKEESGSGSVVMSCNVMKIFVPVLGMVLYMID